MHFKLIPILDQMKQLYKMPRSRARFKEYLAMLQGASKDDMVLPIGGYNPMAKDILLEKIENLQAIRAEEIMEKTLWNINKPLKGGSDRVLEVVLNLSDDVGGAWSNFYTTDFTSRFALNPLVSRNFCTPYIWTSETHTPALIAQRTQAYAYRTLHWIAHGKPLNLKDHVAQELQVQKQVGVPEVPEEQRFTGVEAFYQEHQESEEYNLLFNFFYGDEASQSLAYACYGIPPNGGLNYIAYLASRPN